MTHDDFLKAIAAQPDDRFPKLVYGDWLEEQGDPSADAIRWLAESSIMNFTGFHSVNYTAPFWLDNTLSHNYYICAPTPDRPNWRVAFMVKNYREAIRAYPYLLTEEARTKEGWCVTNGINFMFFLDPIYDWMAPSEWQANRLLKPITQNIS